MDDYSSLAHRIAGGIADVRGCLILSRDGLILGSFPEDESVVKPSWLRFAALGEPERSFVEFAGEVWAYLRRGPYAAFAIAGVGVRPGLLIDQLEQVLMAAEEARTRRETLKVPESPAALSGKPRTSLHPPPLPGPLEPAVSGSDPRPWSRGTRAEVPAPGSEPEEAAAGAKVPGPAADAPVVAAKEQESEGKEQERGAKPSRDDVTAPDQKKRKKDDERDRETPAARGEPKASPDGGTPSDGAGKDPALELEPDAEVDRVLLAKEFSGLLQVERPDDEVES